MPNQANRVKMTKMLASIAVVFVAIGVRVPLAPIICMRMMGLMKRVVLHRFGSTFHARYEQGNHQQLWNPVFHAHSVQELATQVQKQFTHPEITGPDWIGWHRAQQIATGQGRSHAFVRPSHPLGLRTCEKRTGHRDHWDDRHHRPRPTRPST